MPGHSPKIFEWKNFRSLELEAIADLRAELQREPTVSEIATEVFTRVEVLEALSDEADARDFDDNGPKGAA